VKARTTAGSENAHPRAQEDITARKVRHDAVNKKVRSKNDDQSSTYMVKAAFERAALEKPR
jgi:hypothetical protein